MAERTPSPAAARAWELVNGVVQDGRRSWTRLVAEEAGMPYSRVRALGALRDGPLTMGELAARSDVDAPAATGIVDTLEERGYAVRSTSPESRRVRIVTLTPAGAALLDRVGRIPVPMPDAFADLPAAELQELARILAPLVAP